MKILNFGSLNIDYVYAVDHFVRPGETLSSEKLELHCGGKGLNQSIALARAGAQIYHAGSIGRDGEMLKNRLSENKVNTDFISYADCPSGHAIIQVDKSGQNCILLFGGANQAITEKQVDEVINCFEKDDILLLQNEINCMEYIMKRAFDRGMKIALNPSPINDSLKKYPFKFVKYFILNEIEGNEITGKTKPQEIAESLLESYPDSEIVLTLGKKGVVFYNKDKSLSHGIYDVKPADTTAAGDTFTGYFLASVLEGLDEETALKRASIASSISVSRPGASDSIPFRDEVLNSNLKLVK